METDNPCNKKMGKNVEPQGSGNQVLNFPENTVSKVMCRPPILFIQFFNLLLACLLFYVFYLYTSGFQTWQTPLTSIFLILSLVFLLTFFYAFRRARLLTETVLFAVSEKAKSEQQYKRRKSGNDDFLEMIKYDNLMDFFAKYFYMEGEYYLLKLNVSEGMEHVNQLINIFTIFGMSVYYVLTIFIVLVLESLHNAWFCFEGQSLQARDHQALVDLPVDFFACFPRVLTVTGLPVMSKRCCKFVLQRSAFTQVERCTEAVHC